MDSPDASRTTMITCPNCGREDASTTVRWHGAGGPTEIEAFDCPNGCHIDDEAIRQIIGTSGN